MNPPNPFDLMFSALGAGWWTALGCLILALIAVAVMMWGRRP